jgi:hypothetical protein
MACACSANVIARPEIEIGDVAHRPSISFPEHWTDVAFEAWLFVFAVRFHGFPSLGWTEDGDYPASKAPKRDPASCPAHSQS